MKTIRRLLSPRLGFVLVAIGLLMAPPPASPWGCEGHQTIALIAERQLTPHAVAMAKQLLQGQPDPSLHRFCGPGGLDSFADLSTWADDFRDLHPETGGWHFIDIPLDASRNALGDFCPQTVCVTTIIKQKLDLLRSPGGNSTGRSQAVMFLIHLVGDLHQPLHTTTNNDRGANCIPITFFNTNPKLEGRTQAEQAKENYRPNLHAAWDTDLIKRISKNQTVQQFADRLTQDFASQITLWKQQPVNLDDWAWESHEKALAISYGKLPIQVPHETPQQVTQCGDDNHISKRMLALHEKIGAQYLNETTQVIDEQIAKAGTRLAVLLNQLWP